MRNINFDELSERLDHWLLARWSREVVAHLYAIAVIIFLMVCAAFVISIGWVVVTYAECANLLFVALIVIGISWFIHLIAKAIIIDLPTRKPHDDSVIDLPEDSA